MAQPSTVRTLPSGKPAADGFLNISLVDANGKEHKLRVGIPLHNTNRVERSILAKGLEDNAHQFKLVTSVYVNDDPSRDDSDLEL